jgi:phosphoglycolate phosphatase-like HAD superfamily hydrolase
MIQKAMYRLGVTDSKQVITVGDTPSDIEAGINAGCLLSLGVTNGTHTREQLLQHSHDGLLDSLSELKDKIRALTPEAILL